VIATPTAARIVAGAQISRNKSVLSGVFKRMRAPHARRGTYSDLRVMHRVFEEAGALADRSRADIFDLVRNKLKIVSPDTVKGLDDLFRNWQKEASE
jgi:hypothetical protein